MKWHPRQLLGILIPFGSPSTPVSQGLWRRFDPATGDETPLLFLPLAGIPRTLAQDSPREASPTGKSGCGIATYSIAFQPVNQAMRNTIMTQPNAMYKGESKLQTQGVVNPFASQVKQFDVVPHSTKWG